jgi:ABC-type branched-subunit amino acid transport system substrate-binding protein
MNPIGGKDPDGRDDIVSMTMRPAFRKWPWRPFREVMPDIVELQVGPSVSDGAAHVREFLRGDGAKVSVVVGASDVVPGNPDADDTPLITLLNRVADRLHGRSDGALSFPRTRLLGYLAALNVERPARRELSYELVKKLRKYWRDPDSVVAQDGSFVPDVVRAASAGPMSLFLEVASRLLQPHFSLWLWGAPGLGRECRWLRWQRKAAGSEQGFPTFALGLTRGREMPADEVQFLAVRAFLEDLRVAYRPRLWQRRSWRRVRRPVLLLDRLDPALPLLLDRARREAALAGDKPSPLLVLTVPKAGQKRPAIACIPMRVPEQLGQHGQPPYRPLRPWLARMTSVAGVLAIPAIAAVLILGLPGGLVPRSQAAAKPVVKPVAGCPHLPGSRGENHLGVTSWRSPAHDIECVGYIDYSGRAPYVFSNPGQSAESAVQRVQDERIEHDQRAIFAENHQVDMHVNGRTVVELVYFAGLTEGANEDYDTAEAEELEGLYAAQKAQLDEEDAPLLKVVVANGGSKNLDAAPVARMLVSLFRKDRRLLGVVGMDRSITPVQDAIQTFSRARISVLATTLSADGIGENSPNHFQLSPSNTQEAALMLQYIQRVVPLYFSQRRSSYDSGGQLKPTSITVYEPTPYSEVRDSLGHRESVTDLYTLTLEQDLKKLAPGYPGIGEPAFTSQLEPAQLCGSSRVDIYDGRHDRPLASTSQFDDFTLFLRTIAGDCPSNQQPFIIADDGVTRFIADPAARNQLGLGNLVISYVTKGIAIMRTRGDCLRAATAGSVPVGQQQFCEEYATIASQLRALPKIQGQGVDLLWTGERVGLAYDAAMVFIHAEQNYEKDHSAQLPAAAVPREIESFPYQGVTGSADFTGTAHLGASMPGGMPLTIVRIHLSSPAAIPVCAYPGPDGRLFDLLPSTGKCPDGYL